MCPCTHIANKQKILKGKKHLGFQICKTTKVLYTVSNVLKTETHGSQHAYINYNCIATHISKYLYSQNTKNKSIQLSANLPKMSNIKATT